MPFLSFLVVVPGLEKQTKTEDKNEGEENLTMLILARRKLSAKPQRFA